MKIIINIVADIHDNPHMSQLSSSYPRAIDIRIPLNPIKNSGSAFLWGRAVTYELFPLTSFELGDIDPDRALNFGTIPVHYITKNPRPLLKSYINNYIKEEIIDEALTGNIPSFAKFLHIVALTHGQLLNYTNVGREAGVSPNTVRDYYQILMDTRLGFELSPWTKKKTRRLIETAKFYLLDVGVANHLNPEITSVVEGTDVYGNAFEHFMIQEIRAYLAYREKDYTISFWRTASGLEVDLIIGNMDMTLEFKSTKKIRPEHLKGTRALREEHKVGRSLIVSRDQSFRKTEDSIELLCWKKFCSLLWEDELI